MKAMRYVLLVAVTILFAGCATKGSSFYLVHDPEGKIGEVTVKNPQGAVKLSAANEKVQVSRADEAPGAPCQATTEEIRQKFKDSLDALPPPPKHFTIYFPTAADQIGPDARPVVDEVLAEVQKRDSRDVSINGYTDRTGDLKFNMQLSMRRADSIKKALIQRGIASEYITIEYYGENNPVIPTAKNVSEPKNRRVEVVVR